MKDANDAIFEDGALEASIKAAFNAVDPGEEAAARMLSRVLAHREQTQDATRPFTPVVLTLEERGAAYAAEAQAVLAAEAAEKEAARARAAAKAEAQAAISTGQATVIVGGKQDEAELSDAAKIVAAARASAPKPKRKVRPWQLAVPAAAVVILGVVLVASGPVLDSFTKGGAEQQVAQYAEDLNAKQEAAQAQQEAISEESQLQATAPTSSGDVAADEASMESASKDAAESSMASTADEAAAENTSSQAAGSDAAKSSEDATEADSSQAAAETTQEEMWARDYQRIVYEDGTELVIDDADDPRPVDKSLVGGFIGNAVAYNADETASVSCEIYATANGDDSIYYVSYLGEDIYYTIR